MIYWLEVFGGIFGIGLLGAIAVSEEGGFWDALFLGFVVALVVATVDVLIS